MKNLTLLTDLYELTMMQGYFKEGKQDTRAVFDLYYRTNPFNGAYAIACGLDSVIDYIENLKFDGEAIDYLRSFAIFKDDFLEYLRDFTFTGDIYSVAEGSVIFPSTPILRVEAPLCQTQLIESALLNMINHQSLIATKASRVKSMAGDDTVLEFGLRRAQGVDAAVSGARAAIIGGCSATSNVLTGYKYDVAVAGTHAHSWIMSFDSELEAFMAYADLYPDACILLVDTYNTLKSGVPNAIRVFNHLKEKGIKPKTYGIRLDSGDLSYLSKKARIMLDDAGFEDAIISASSDLDEYLIADMKSQNCKVTLWGVGTKLITADDNPSFGGVYKLAALENSDGILEAKIKLSDNPAKVTNPGKKKLLRIYDKKTGKIRADLIALEDEVYNESDELLLFDPQATWKKLLLAPNTYTIREMLIPIYKNGKLVYKSPKTMEIREYCMKELASLWDESKRLNYPQTVYVDLSQKLFDLKNQMIHDARN